MKINFFTYTYNILMVVKTQKNLMHDVVMNHIPKKKAEPPKISLEKMVKEHIIIKQQSDTKILNDNTSNLQKNDSLEKISIQNAGTFQHKPKDLNVVSKNISNATNNNTNTLNNNTNTLNNNTNTVQNIVSTKDNLIKIETVNKDDDINNLIVSLGGELHTKSNSRKKPRNNIKTTIEKLIDSKLKSDYIEKLINNQQEKAICNLTKISPQKKVIDTKPAITDKLIDKGGSINNVKDINKQIVKSPNRMKFKSESNIKSKILAMEKSKNLNNNISSLKSQVETKKKTNTYIKKSVSNINNSVSNIQNEKFRDYKMKIKTDSRKKSGGKKSKKNKNNKKKSKKKSPNNIQTIELKNNVPSYLQMDLKKLITKDIQINNDSNFNFNKHKSTNNKYINKYL